MLSLSVRTRMSARPRVWIAVLTVFALLAPLSGCGSSMDASSATSISSGPGGAVTSVSVSPSSVSGTLGSSTQFSAAATDASGASVSGQAVTWTSSDSTIVAISRSGLARSVGIGTATINATAGNGVAGVATAAVGGAPAIASISVAPSQVNVSTGQLSHFTVTLKDASGNILTNRRVLWKSHNPSVMKVDTAGTGTPVAPGSDTISVVSAGVTDSAVANVTTSPGQPGAVSDLTVVATTDTSATLRFTQVSDGNGGAASYDVRYAAGTITFASAASVTRGSCATPLAGTSAGSSMTCVVYGLTQSTVYNFQVMAFRGTSIVNAVLGGVSNIASGTTTLTAQTPVASVAVTPATTTSTVGSGGVQFAAVLKSASGNVLTGQAVTWSSSNPSVATINASGLATTVAAGTATITATSGTASGTATLTVTAIPAPGTVSNLSVAATADTAATLTFTQVTDGAGGAASYDVRYAVAPLTWATATEATRGTCATPVAGTTVGTALTCTVFGLTANTAYQFQVVAFRGTLNVNAVVGALSNVASATTARTAVASVAVTPLTGTVAVGSTMPFTATPKDIHNNPVSGWPVAWSSSSTTIATVGSTTGLVTGVAAGAATITATIDGQSGTAAATVSPVGTGLYPNQPAGYTRLAETNDALLPFGAGGGVLAGTTANAGANPSRLLSVVSGASLPVTFPNQTTAQKFVFEAGTPPGYQEAGSDWAGYYLWDNATLSGAHGGPAANEYSAFYQSTWFSVYGNGTTIEVPTAPGIKVLGYRGQHLQQPEQQWRLWRSSTRCSNARSAALNATTSADDSARSSRSTCTRTRMGSARPSPCTRTSTSASTSSSGRCITSSRC